MVALGFGTFARADRIFALERITGDERGDGRRTRVWIDGVLAIDNWRAHESTVDFTRLAGGHHDLRVQYYQGDGYYELKLDIVRGRERSPGSPGAHGSD